MGRKKPKGLKVDVPDEFNEFAGYVVFKKPLSFPDIVLWSAALDKVDGKFRGGKQRGDLTLIAIVTAPTLVIEMLPAIIELVEVWNCKGIPKNPTLKTFPATPRSSISRFLIWMLAEINEIIEPTTDEETGLEERAEDFAAPIEDLDSDEAKRLMEDDDEEAVGAEAEVIEQADDAVEEAPKKN